MRQITKTPTGVKMTHVTYIKALNEIFDRYGFGINVTENDLRFLNQIVTDEFTCGRRLTKHLSSAISPAIHSGQYYHYSKRQSVDAILSSRTLRLTSIEKRINEQEIEGFLQKFDFQYPLSIDPDTNERRYVTSIARQIFYTSFTDTCLIPEEEDYFWTEFAHSDGARLKFQIELQSGCLRRMIYGDDVEKWALFFKEVNELTKNQLGKIFFWGDSATVCALHLPDKYNIERETRLITRRGCGLQQGSDGAFDYLELRFGLNDAIKVDLKLLEIQTDQPIRNTCGAIVTPRTKAAINAL